LSIKGQEMHKSLGNFVPIQEAIQRVGVEALRVLYASTHYRSPLDYTEETLVQAASLARRFRRAYDQLQLTAGNKSEGKAEISALKRQVDEARTEFFAAMDDDFNTPGALAAYIRIVGIAEEQAKILGTESASILFEAMKELASILGLLETESVPRREFLEIVNLLAALRNDLRAKREYALSDRIREQMQKAGVMVEDEAK
jgi:cysteinyl-tRNA synthetase